MKAPGERWLILALCVALVAISWSVFGQTLLHDFVNYDDDAYVHLQPKIVRGVTAAGVRWAFAHTHSGNWHPLTSISHMLDCQLWGLNPRGHHLDSVLLHSLNAALLLLALRALTMRLWPSAFIAAVFAISAAGGIGRLDCRAEGRAERALFYADAAGLCGIRAPSIVVALSAGGGRVGLWLDGKTNARDGALSPLALGLLAA